MSKCPYKKCAHDHYDHKWLDEILFLNLGLDLTTRDTQYPTIRMEDLHEARARIVEKVAQPTQSGEGE